MDKSDINFVAKVVASKKYVKQWLPFIVVSLVVFVAVIALLMRYLPINIFAVITPIVALSLLVAVTLGVGIFLRLTNHCIPIDKWRCFIAPCLVAIIFAVALVNVFIPNAKAYSAIKSDCSLSNNELTLERYKGKDQELTLSSTITWNRREYALKAIGAKAFANSSLKKISIPDSVTSIAPDAFAGCTAIENIIVDENNAKYASADGMLYDKAMANMLYFPIGKAGEVTFGQHFEDLSFLNGAKNLTKITFLSQVPPSQGVFDTGNADLVIEVPREVYDVYKVSLKDAPVKVEITTTSEERIAYFEHATDGIPTYAIYDENYQAPILTRVGYTFVGWGEQGATTPFDMTKLMKSIRLYPIWTANMNTIIFDSNGGSGTMSNQTMATDSQVALNANTYISPKDGYSFGGWSMTATGAVEYLDMANYTMGVDSSYTLYAVWERDWSYGSPGLEYTALSDGSYSVSQGTAVPENGEIFILSTYNGNIVTSIGDNAFDNCSALTSITIPSSVTSIGYDAFEGCSALTSINVDNNNQKFSSINGNLYNKDKTTLIQYALGKTNTSFVIPNSVTSIGVSAFEGCSALTSITIPNSVTSIGNASFNGCSALTSITIPNSVTSIGIHAFYYCSALTSINVDNDNQKFSSINGNLYNKDKTTLIQYTIGKTNTSFVIPSSVTSIGEYAFSCCSALTNITIPNSVTSIGEYAFSYCSALTSITIPNSVTSIGIHAFDNCSALTSITIPSSVTSIGRGAFEGCSALTSITIPNSVTSIGYGAFEGCSALTSITIPSSVTSIDNWAFRDCSALTNINVDNDNQKFSSINGNLYNKDKTTLIQYALGKTNTSFVIPNSVTSIGEYAFSYCSALTSVTIPESVRSIGVSAFEGCSALTNVTIPNSVTSIGEYAFSYCSALTSITIANSVTSIGNASFNGCSALTSVTIPESVRSIGVSAFENCSRLTSITIPSSVVSIGVSAFENCSRLTSITIPNSVTSIGNASFNGCSALTSVTIPESVRSIGVSAFENCSRLTSITIPSSVVSIGVSAFENCSRLTSITIPNSVTSIGNASFNGCSALTSVTIPESVRSIGVSAFEGCSALTNVTIPNSVTSIGVSAFEGCSALTSITIPNSVTSIGNASFNGCSALTSITIPNSVTSIGVCAFYYCSALTSITIPNSVISIGQAAFARWTNKQTIYIDGRTAPGSGWDTGWNNVCSANIVYRPNN